MKIAQWIKGQKVPAKQITWYEDTESGREVYKEDSSHQTGV